MPIFLFLEEKIKCVWGVGGCWLDYQKMGHLKKD